MKRLLKGGQGRSDDDMARDAHVAFLILFWALVLVFVIFAGGKL